MSKVSIKALRFYEEAGLLSPVSVDIATGYRYYDTFQLPIIHKIVALRQCGFSISDIKDILDGSNIHELLKSQKEKLQKIQRENEVKLSSVSSYLKFLDAKDKISYEVVIKPLPEVIVYSCRMAIKSYACLFDEIPKIGQEVLKANPTLKCKEDPFYCFNTYFTNGVKEKDIEFEYCEAVVQKGIDTERIKFKKIESVASAACVMHKGPYSTLSNAYEAVYKWIESNNLRCFDYPRESYIDGIWNKDSSDEWLTEIQVPLESK